VVILPAIIAFIFINNFDNVAYSLSAGYFWVGALAFAFIYSSYKTKLKFTYRATLNIVFCNYVQIMLVVILGLFVTNAKALLLTCVAIYALTPIFIIGSYSLLNAVFVKKNQKFIIKSKEKLNKINPLKIGITGSYGKTSCKNILSHLLSGHFKVCATEKNYNTPMGIAIAIDKMNDDTEVFIAEMGARKTGDIAELCSLVEPDYGIITGVTNQHLETFKSIENIFEEKYNLAISLTDKSTCVFNGTDKYTLKMYKQYKGKKAVIKLNNFADLYANNIIADSEGCQFTINYKEERLECQTKLLGRHNIVNILLCSALALELGVDSDTLVKKIETLPQVAHRLQLIKSNGMNILDDSYNANTLGIKYSLECLGYFDTRKVVLTQGIVELGKEQSKANKQIGYMIGSVADVVILCGINAPSIKEGLEECGFSKQMFSFNSLKEAKQNFSTILKKGDTLLIQNDLPDVI
jgi:UDP-N-acetylmuramoyl-tripeptide--D-alanyl-D-alanine ligase